VLSAPETALRRARALLRQGADDEAKLAYLQVLQADPTHCGALTELGALAHASGFVSAARDAYREAVRCHPGSKVAQVGYAWLLNEAGDYRAARQHYQAALAIDPDLPEAHQGLARVLTELGEDATAHWHQGFTGRAVLRRRYRGPGAGIPLLLLVAASGGNIPTQHWIDDRIYAVTALYTEFHIPTDPLPPHAMIVNAIGDADLCPAALANAQHILANRPAPLLNPPEAVAATGRAHNAHRLGQLPNVIAPRILPSARARELGFPLLLRAPGYHTGQHFLRVEAEADLPEAAAALPPRDTMAIEYLNATGPDSMARKYRVMFIGGALYPLHLAISPHWKVHYFTAGMAENPAFRAEEQRFLDAMPAVLGPRAMEALAAIQATMGLDYAGIDFALTEDGSLLLFEANATMAIIPLPADPLWDYRRQAVNAALAAARRLLPTAHAAPAHAATAHAPIAHAATA
jgi:glutathione synthase/RimK-type ligase-like ATP-grasp enzyme